MKNPNKACRAFFNNTLSNSSPYFRIFLSFVCLSIHSFVVVTVDMLPYSSSLLLVLCHSGLSAVNNQADQVARGEKYFCTVTKALLEGCLFLIWGHFLSGCTAPDAIKCPLQMEIVLHMQNWEDKTFRLSAVLISSL